MFATKSLRVLSPLWLATSLLATTPVAPTHGPRFNISARWTFAGPAAWNNLALDSVRHRLYISQNDQVSIIDTNSGKLAGQIGGFQNARAICLDPTGTQAWVSDGVGETVSAVDLATGRINATVGVGSNPNQLVYDAQSQSLLVLRDGIPSVTFLSTSAFHVTGTLALPGIPSSVATDGTGHAWITLAGPGELVEVNLASRQISSPSKLEGCTGPHSIMAAPTAAQLLVVCENRRLESVRARDGKVVATSSFDPGVRELAFDPERGLLFGANGSGVLDVLRQTSGGRFVSMQTVKTQVGARTMAYDPIRRRVFLPAADFGQRSNTSEELVYRPTPVPGTFRVLVVSR